MMLSSVTFFARDVDRLASFYAEAIGLEQTVDDSPRFRELAGGGARIGFAYPGAYQLLALEEQADPRGLRTILTFALTDAGEMDGAIARAVDHGATVVKAPYQTHFGQLMAVLRDPEGNAFRLNAALPA